MDVCDNGMLNDSRPMRKNKTIKSFKRILGIPLLTTDPPIGIV